MILDFAYGGDGNPVTAPLQIYLIYMFQDY
jgi:hypothetical protein